MTAKIIFVLSEARTGSTLLCQLLANYKNVINFHEAFHDVGDLRAFDVFNTNVSFNNVLQYQFGDGVFDREKMFPRIIADPKKLLTLMADNFNDNETLVVKIHLFQLFLYRYPVSRIFDWILTQPNHRFMLLDRDFLKSHVSLLKAEQTNEWHNVDTTNIKVTIDLSRFQRELTENTWRYSTIKEKLKDNNIDYLSINYDRDLKNYSTNEFNQLVEPWSTRQGLDLKLKSTMYSRVQKQNTDDDISNSISNWAEIKEMLNR
jgi:LPS sulfotransferase NodH